MDTEARLPRLLTAQEVAAQTGLPLARIYELSRNGEIPVVRLGRSLRFSEAALVTWLDAGGTARRAA